MLRIKQLRERKGLNMKEAAKALGMPYTTYVNYEKGLREPTSEVLIDLADYFETTVDYLVGRTDNQGNICRKASMISAEDEELLRKFHCLDERGKSAVLNVLNHEYESLPGEKARSAPKEA